MYYIGTIKKMQNKHNSLFTQCLLLKLTELRRHIYFKR